MLIKWTRRSVRRLVLFVAVISIASIAVEFTIKQHCVCFPCVVIGHPPVPCQCTSLGRYYFRRVLGHGDLEYFSSKQSNHHGAAIGAKMSESQSPCMVSVEGR